MLIVMLIFCDYARTYAPFLWWIMPKRGNYARGCAQLFKKYYFGYPSLSCAILFVSSSVSAAFSLFRSRALFVVPRTFLFCLHFILQRCSTPQTIPP